MCLLIREDFDCGIRRVGIPCDKAPLDCTNLGFGDAVVGPRRNVDATQRVVVDRVGRPAVLIGEQRIDADTILRVAVDDVAIYQRAHGTVGQIDAMLAVALDAVTADFGIGCAANVNATARIAADRVADQFVVLQRSGIFCLQVDAHIAIGRHLIALNQVAVRAHIETIAGILRGGIVADHIVVRAQADLNSKTGVVQQRVALHKITGAAIFQRETSLVVSNSVVCCGCAVLGISTFELSK